MNRPKLVFWINQPFRASAGFQLMLHNIGGILDWKFLDSTKPRPVCPWIDEDHSAGVGLAKS